MSDFKSNILKYNYRIFGINVASEFNLPQLMSTEGETEVLIQNGKVPDTIPDAVAKADFFQASKSELIFSVKNVGRYYIRQGKNIIIEPASGHSEQLLSLYLLGSAMGALLFQRGVVPVHGSAVVVKNKSIIITGGSGAGKSSLTLAFRKRGFPFLTDDIAALKRDEDGWVYVQPAYPQQKLWRDCIENVGEDATDLEQINTDKSKYFFPACSGFCESPVRLGTICEIVPSDCDHVELQVISGVEKLNILMKNVYRYQVSGFFWSGEEVFSKCLDIANKVDVFRLVRPVNQFSVEEQVDLILGRLGGIKDGI